MKLLRLNLKSDFRSLIVIDKEKGFEVNFLRDIDNSKKWDFMPYCLVGRNGSGKSNILEALAAIFYHIESMHLINKPDSFDAKSPNDKGFNRDVCYPNAFELEYLFYVQGDFSKEFDASFNTGYEAHIKIIKTENIAPKVLWLNRNEIEKDDRQELTGVEIKNFLPQFIVAYSSGENEILSLPFFKMRFIQYDEYLERLIKGYDYFKPESRFVYLDDSFNQAILLSLYLTNEVNKGALETNILTPFIKEIGIEDIKNFRIIIRKHHLVRIHSDQINTLPIKEQVDVSKLQVELTAKVENLITKLKQCSTTTYFDIDTEELYLDYYVDTQTKKAFKLLFGDALELFQTFQILLNLNLYQVKPELKKKVYHSKNIYLSKDLVPVPYDEDKIFRFKDVVLKKEGVKDIIYTKSLSDGEYQLLHSIGLCLIFKNTPSLFLLDEPETHFNPDWRAKFISTLRDCLEKDKKDKSLMRDLLITSHSPFIISDSHPENVLIFKKDSKTSEVSATRPDFNTFGASVNLITIELFNRVDTIGDLANEKVLEFEKKIEKGEELEKLKTEIVNTLGDSVERTILIHQLNEKLNKK